jgi:hypothetical protein
MAERPKTKKLINAADNVVTELVEGLWLTVTPALPHTKGLVQQQCVSL